MFWWAWRLFSDDRNGVDAKDIAPASISFALMTSSSYFVSALIVAVTRYLHSVLLAIFLSPNLTPNRIGLHSAGSAIHGGRSSPR